MLKDKFYSAIATGFGSGKTPFAPGTFGSLAAVIIWIAVNHYYFILFPSSTLANIVMWLFVITATFFIGIKSANFYCQKHRKKDAGEVVIDEFCGQWLALFIVCLGSGAFGYNMTSINLNYFICILSSFILFRIFDISKPWIIKRIDKNVSGGLGVMLDDLVAGLFAGLVFILIKIALFL